MKTSLTKDQIKLHVFASKSYIRPELASVYTDGVKAVATDSFRLVEITKTETTGEAINPVLMRETDLKHLKIPAKDKSITLDTGDNITATIASETTAAPVMLHASADQFPKYEELFTQIEDKNTVTFTCNGEYLAEILKALAALDTAKYPRNEVTLTIPKKVGYPVIVTATSDTQSARALLMPLNK
jgi:DNA polymerase III sliding clamp (beta) subunit (PCNA family)